MAISFKFSPPFSLPLFLSPLSWRSILVGGEKRLFCLTMLLFQFQPVHQFNHSFVLLTLEWFLHAFVRITHQITFPLVSFPFTFLSDTLCFFDSRYFTLYMTTVDLLRGLTLQSSFLCFLYQSYRIYSSVCCSIQANSVWLRVPAKCFKCRIKTTGLQTRKSWWVVVCRNAEFTCINAGEGSQSLCQWTNTFQTIQG